MKITLVGAAEVEVTGSCYSVQTKRARILVDCGLFQGEKIRGSQSPAALARLIPQRHRLSSKLPKMGEVIEL